MLDLFLYGLFIHTDPFPLMETLVSFYSIADGGGCQVRVWKPLTPMQVKCHSWNHNELSPFFLPA